MKVSKWRKWCQTLPVSCYGKMTPILLAVALEEKRPCYWSDLQDQLQYWSSGKVVRGIR